MVAVSIMELALLAHRKRRSMLLCQIDRRFPNPNKLTAVFRLPLTEILEILPCRTFLIKIDYLLQLIIDKDKLPMPIQRNTIQRQIILKALGEFSSHPTVDDVHAELQKTHPTISKSTVYRNLRQLAESGEVRQILLPGATERYDRRSDQHYHFQCKGCGSICDVDIDYLREINDAVRQKYGIRVDSHEVVFRGLCPKCEATQAATAAAGETPLGSLRMPTIRPASNTGEAVNQHDNKQHGKGYDHD